MLRRSSMSIATYEKGVMFCCPTNGCPDKIWGGTWRGEPEEKEGCQDVLGQKHSWLEKNERSGGANVQWVGNSCAGRKKRGGKKEERGPPSFWKEEAYANKDTRKVLKDGFLEKCWGRRRGKMKKGHFSRWLILRGDKTSDYSVSMTTIEDRSKGENK